jgi:hypothetical protein
MWESFDFNAPPRLDPPSTVPGEGAISFSTPHRISERALAGADKPSGSSVEEGLE